MELLRNFSESTPKLGNRGIPKLLRNWGPWNYGITPKLRTVELWNYSEIGDRGGGTMELLRNYSEIIPKLLRNWGPGS